MDTFGPGVCPYIGYGIQANKVSATTDIKEQSFDDSKQGSSLQRDKA